MNNISQRLSDLRELIRREHLAAFIFPSTDPHQSEYVADHWKGREFISGFNGSAGTAVVTANGAALWTDSRYFLAAEQQLQGTGFQLMRLRQEGTPTVAEWIKGQCTMGNEQCTMGNEQCTEVGVDGMVCSASDVRQLMADLRQAGGYTVRTNLDALQTIWKDRPPMPQAPAFVLPLKYAGETAHEKMARLRRALRQQHADGMLMAALDDIAWTLNLRGSDVHCCPVVVSYLLIDSQRATLYVDPAKLSAEVHAYLAAEGIAVDRYENVRQGLRNYFEYNILMDPGEVNYTLFTAASRPVVEAESPVKRMKAVKNATEQAGFRRAMVRDGVAMVQFLHWLDGQRGLSELSVSSKLESLRAEQPLYQGPSFDTIAAYAEHGAIVHYEPTAETDVPLRPEGLLLVDSGGQYLDGTTDITRTIALGPLTDEMRRVYTLVLKGHLQLQMAVFPAGVSGTQIDALARRDLWAAGYNYGHGTGHGVGAFLNVHEGPHQIRMEWKPAPLVAGMTVTDEPGIYLAGRFGVRIENTLLIVPHAETEFGQFLGFEPLTLCPIDKRPIVVEMLTDAERQHLNSYHELVRQRLLPYVDGPCADWLRQATAPL